MLIASFGKSTKVCVKKSKILVLAEYIGETHNSTAYYWSQIVKALQKSYDVFLIAPDTEHAKEFSKEYRVNTRYVKFSRHNKNNLFSRLFGQLFQTYSFWRSIRNDIEYVDLVFSGTNPIVTMFFMSVMRVKRKFKWLVLVHDVFPNNLIPANIVKSTSFLYKIILLLSAKVYSSPDNIVCIGRDMKELIDQKTGENNKVKVVQNWASTKYIFPCRKDDNEIINYLGWSGKVVFQFFGNMGRLQGVDNLIKAIELTTNENARFLFVGGGSEEYSVKSAAEKLNAKLGYERVHYYGQLDIKKNNTGLNACDVAFVTLAEKMFGLGVPSKAYFSMAADKPILYVGDKGSELELLLSEYDGQLGWHCDTGEPKKLAELIDLITDKYVSDDFQGSPHPRKILEREFSEQRALSSILNVVRETIEK